MIQWLHEPVSAETGGKATHLARMMGAGLPVPPGFALAAPTMSELMVDGESRLSVLEAALDRLGASHVAVRSSGIGEDASNASFAGVHVSRLNVRASPAAVLEALLEVIASSHSDGAKAYRSARGLSGEARMGSVVQAMVEPTVSGVVFGKDPVTGAERLVIEAAWGLGEAIVSGLVTPDHFELEPRGEIVVRHVSDKDLAVVSGENGTLEVEVEPERRRAPCLNDADLVRLHELYRFCHELFGGPQDVEFAVTQSGPVLLQSRPITV